MRVHKEHTPWANQAELYITIFKEAVRWDLVLSHSPMVLWDYCMERRPIIHNSVTRQLFQNQCLTPH